MQFNQKFNRQAKNYVVPPVVDYGKQCRGLCEKKASVYQKAMQEMLWEEWARIFDNPRAVNRDLLMAYEACAGDPDAEPCHIGFAFLTTCACRYGRHPAHQDFLRLELESGTAMPGSYECVLRARRQPYVVPDKEMPRQFHRFFLGALGELDIVTEDNDTMSQ